MPKDERSELVERLEQQLSTCRDSYEAPSGKIMFRVWGNDLAAILKLARAALTPSEQGSGLREALEPEKVQLETRRWAGRHVDLDDVKAVLLALAKIDDAPGAS